jgi:hypothetical protein
MGQSKLFRCSNAYICNWYVVGGRRKLWIAVCGGIILEEALNLSSDRLLDHDDNDDDDDDDDVSSHLL